MDATHYTIVTSTCPRGLREYFFYITWYLVIQIDKFKHPCAKMTTMIQKNICKKMVYQKRLSSFEIWYCQSIETSF